jgi:hypothetical protein
MAPGRSLFPLRLDTWVLGNVEQTDADGQNKTKNLLITFLSCSFFGYFSVLFLRLGKSPPSACMHSLPPPIIISFCLLFRTLALCTSFSLLILLFFWCTQFFCFCLWFVNRRLSLLTHNSCFPNRPDRDCDPLAITCLSFLFSVSLSWI